MSVQLWAIQYAKKLNAVATNLELCERYVGFMDSTDETEVQIRCDISEMLKERRPRQHKAWMTALKADRSKKDPTEFFTND